MWPLIDWKNIMRAARTLLVGGNPYHVGFGNNRFYNPAWTLIFALPFAVIQSHIPTSAMLVIGMVLLTAVTAIRLSPRASHAIFSIGSAAAFGTLCYGNIDALVWAGLLMPLPLGIFFLAMKPQATALVIVVLLLRELRAKGIVPVFMATIPVIVATGVWFLIFGMPDWNMAGNMGNASFWPYGLIVGVPIALMALTKRSVRLAMLAMPFCVPYISINSFLGMSYAYPILGFVIGWARAIGVSQR